LFALAGHLRTTVASLQHSLSAQEFTQWVEWMQAEQIGPDWDARRHAELLAAAHNGAMVKPDKRPFTAAEFLRPDPWLPPEQRPRFLNPADAGLAQLFSGAVNE
jgi:hypothetical protein